MRPLLFLAFLLLPRITDNLPGNPRYDFPELLIARHEATFKFLSANLNAKMDALAISGYYHESIRYQDTMQGLKAPVRLRLAHTSVIDAREFILEQAKKYRVLLINEEHNHPQHRLFTKSLLKGLYAQGYRVLMAEGISMKHNTLDSKGYPTSSDGVYINEPGYASLLRYALNNGYKVHAYEYAGKGQDYWDDSIKLDKYGSIKYISYQPSDSMTLLFDENGLKLTQMTSVREKGQANNIVQVINEHPGSKFVIHVGMGHLYESGPMMGAQLRELLNQEDVLTIDQVQLDDRAAVIDTLTHDTVTNNFPYLLWDSTRHRPYHFWDGAQVDYTIFNAAVRDSLLRPGFLFGDVEKRIVRPLAADQLKDCPCLFSAYDQQEYTKEGPGAVAIDVVYIKNERRPPLLLYKGAYTVVKKNRDGAYTLFNMQVK